MYGPSDREKILLQIPRIYKYFSFFHISLQFKKHLQRMLFLEYFASMMLPKLGWYQNVYEPACMILLRVGLSHGHVKTKPRPSLPKILLSLVMVLGIDILVAFQ